jgi:hypothetical protein
MALLGRFSDPCARAAYDLPALLVTCNQAKLSLNKAFQIACATLGKDVQPCVFKGVKGDEHVKFHSSTGIMLYDLSEWTLDQNIESIMTSCKETSAAYNINMTRRIILVHMVDRLPIFTHRIFSYFIEKHCTSSLFILTATSMSACSQRLRSAVVHVRVPCDHNRFFETDPKFKSIQSVESAATYIRNGKLKPSNICIHISSKLKYPMPWWEACAKGDHILAVGARTPTETITCSKYLPSKNIVLMMTASSFITEKTYVTIK